MVFYSKVRIIILKNFPKNWFIIIAKVDRSQQFDRFPEVVTKHFYSFVKISKKKPKARSIGI